MSSIHLHTRAESILDDRGKLVALRSWFTNARGEGAQGHADDGQQVTENCIREAHFGGPRTPDAAAYANFLELVSTANESARKAYEMACRLHQLRGTPVPAAELPDTAWRYVTWHALRRSLSAVNPVLGALMRDEATFASEVRVNWPVWKPFFERAHLGAPNHAVFAAVPVGLSPAQQCGAVAATTFDRLGLPARPESRFELAYPTAALDEVRVPTVADPGWFAFFRPADEDATMGRTAPRTGAGQGFDEVVHASRDMEVLNGPPRWLK